MRPGIDDADGFLTARAQFGDVTHLAREVEPGFHWIQEPGPDRSSFVESVRAEPPDWYDPEEPMYVPQNAYLLNGEEGLLFDTLSPASSDEILDALDSILDGELDYLVVSHPDVPHAGNAEAILEAHPGATLVAPRYGNAHELYHLDDARKVGEGDGLDLGGFEVAFHEAAFPDAPVHVWMTEQTTGTLFTVDWLGYPHRDSETLRFPDEFDTDLTVDRLVQFHGRVLFWFQYVDLDAVGETVERLIDRYDPATVAPGHGNPVREDPVEVMGMTRAVAERVRREGRVGTLG